MDPLHQTQKLYWLSSTDEMWHAAWSCAEIAGKPAAAESSISPMVLSLNGVPVTLSQLADIVHMSGDGGVGSSSTSALKLSRSWAATSALAAGLSQTALQVVELSKEDISASSIVEALATTLQVRNHRAISLSLMLAFASTPLVGSCIVRVHTRPLTCIDIHLFAGRMPTKKCDQHCCLYLSSPNSACIAHAT